MVGATLMADDDNVRIDTRLAGQLTRYHTWPKIHNQSIGEHSWQILRIYSSVVDAIDPGFVLYTVFHDIGEHTTGDMPYPIKRDNPDLQSIMTRLEIGSMLRQMAYWGSIPTHEINSDNMRLFKQIELMEMAEWGMDEVCLGNSHGYTVADRCLRALYGYSPCQRLCEYVIKRLDLFFKQYQLGVRKEQYELKDHWRITKWKESCNERRN
jgi:hypothetical protein